MFFINIIALLEYVKFRKAAIRDDRLRLNNGILCILSNSYYETYYVKLHFWKVKGNAV